MEHISQRKFNFIMNELKQHGLDMEHPLVIELRENVLIGAEIMTMKEIKDLIDKSIDSLPLEIYQ